MKSINEYGAAPILEQAAEECAELAQACLKLSRKLRGENPTDETWAEIWDNLCEEIDDVVIAVEALCETNTDGKMLLAETVECAVKAEVPAGPMIFTEEVK